jgi:hypothetical protein
MNTKMKKVLAVAMAVLVPAVASAETIDYSCQYEGKGKAYPLHIDESKKVVDWQGKRYTLTASGSGEDIIAVNGEVCGAKWCFNAMSLGPGNDGTSFTIGTATQGVASFTYKGKDLECAMKGSRYYVKP